MDVLVTGGAGFIGSHVVRALRERGDAVTVLDAFDDAYDPARKERNLAGIDARVVRGDVTDPRAVDEALAPVVVHLAARAGVRESVGQEALYERVNAGGTACVIGALRRRGGRMVLMSSSAVYGARTEGPFREDDPVAPASPYAWTKLAAEDLARAASHDHGLPVTILRPFTVYGPRQRPGMAVERFVRAALTAEPAPVFGNGARDLTYVDDVVAAVLAAIDRPAGYAIVNVGGGIPIRLDALVDAVGRAVGRPVPVVAQPPAPGDVPFTWADRSRAEQVLGWTPRIGLSEGLARTAAWFRAGEP